MFVVALCSACGGVGRSSLTAGLATALARRGQSVLAIDFDPQNVLGRHLGIDTLAEGLGTSTAETWGNTAWHTSDGIDFVPFGTPSSIALNTLAFQIGEQPGWLYQRLEQLALPKDTTVIIDSARHPSSWATAARYAADLELFIAHPDPISISCFDELSSTAENLSGLALLLNDVDPTRSLHRDILLLARNRWPEYCLPYPVHRDAAMAEALASGQSIFDYDSRAQAAHDLQGVAEWLSKKQQVVTAR